jgi:hypothetical protein
MGPQGLIQIQAPNGGHGEVSVPTHSDPATWIEMESLLTLSGANVVLKQIDISVNKKTAISNTSKSF